MQRHWWEIFSRREPDHSPWKHPQVDSCLFLGSSKKNLHIMTWNIWIWVAAVQQLSMCTSWPCWYTFTFFWFSNLEMLKDISERNITLSTVQNLTFFFFFLQKTTSNVISFQNRADWLLESLFFSSMMLWTIHLVYFHLNTSVSLYLPPAHIRFLIYR